MKILKKIAIIYLLLIILLYSIIPPKTVFADDTNLSSSQEAGRLIASFAKDMVENHASETIYDYGDYWPSVGMPINYGRLMAYQGVKVTGYAQGSNGTLKQQTEPKFFMDCVGFVSFCIHHSLGISGNADGNFVTPNGIRSSAFTYVTGPLQPGDILVRSGSHVMIYVGEGYVAEAQDADSTWQVKKRNTWPTYDKVARITDQAAQKLLKENTKGSWDGQATTGGITFPDGEGGIGFPEVDDSEAFDKYIGTGNTDGLGNSKNFYYNGIPKSGEYLGKTEDSNWLFDTLNSALDWLIGLITMGWKIQFIGWATIAENIATGFVADIDVYEYEERLTVENIIFNQIPILDVDVFDYQTAGGYVIEQTDVVYILRQTVANWYVALRTIVIIGLLFTLIYVGIRMALDSVVKLSPKENSKYKKMLVDWLVSFIIVMCIHYFMVVVIHMNDSFVSMLKPEGSTAELYEQARASAYEIPASKGLTGTIIYVFLVYYFIKMLILYFKRVLIVYILILISPLIGISYTIEKMKGKSKSFTIWMKEFSFNVLIQVVHAVIYSIFMFMVYKFAFTADALRAVPYLFILFILLNFILEAEDLIKKIFRMEAKSLKSIVESAIGLAGKVATAVAIATPFIGLAKRGIEKAYDKNMEESSAYRYNHLKLKDTGEFSEGINAQIEELRKMELAHIKEYDANAVKFAKDKAKAIQHLAQAIPISFEKPLTGIGALGTSALDMRQDLKTGKQSKLARKMQKSTSVPSEVMEEFNNANSKNGKGKERSTDSNGKKTIKGASKKYNTRKKKKFVPAMKKIGGTVVDVASAGESKEIRSVRGKMKSETQLIRETYAPRIVALSRLRNKVEVVETTINTEVQKIKSSNYPPIYYTPKQGESKSSIAMNEKLREKYREMLEINIRQAYGGVLISSDKVKPFVAEYSSEKTTIGDVQSIAKQVLAEENLTLSSDFKDNLLKQVNNELVRKIKDESNTDKGNTNSKSVFRKVNLSQNVEERIKKAIEESDTNETSIHTEMDKAVTTKEKEDMIDKLEVNELTELITKALAKEGSIEKQEVIYEFSTLVDSIQELGELNRDVQDITGKEVLSTDRIVNMILNKDIME